MIKLIISMAMVLVSLLSFAQTQQKVNISADLRGRSCSGGYGLCSPASVTEKAGGLVVAQKIGETTVLIILDKANLTIENQKSIAGKELYKVAPSEKIDFVQEASVTFDAQLLLKLGFDPKYKIVKSGSYPMIIEKDSVLVTLSPSEEL